MANDFEYVKDYEEPCLSQWPEAPEADLYSDLQDWGIVKLSSLDEMENWYDKVHVEVHVEHSQVTAAELRFTRLKREWIRGTEKSSILSQIVLHSAYQQIIAMGPEAIPLILRSLQHELDHWFWALTILNEGCDVAEGATRMPEAAEAWLHWGKEKGHLD
jgi:hypothetical protein